MELETRIWGTNYSSSTPVHNEMTECVEEEQLLLPNAEYKDSHVPLDATVTVTTQGKEGNEDNEENALQNNIQACGELKYRHICKTDVEALRSLDEHCYPIRYDDDYYLYVWLRAQVSIACFDEDGNMVGAIVAKYVKDGDLANGRLVAYDWITKSKDEPIGLYIMTLGVDSKYRGRGIGRCLLQYCTEEAMRNPQIKIIFLHTELTNETAQQFYVRNGFSLRTVLPSYYVINGQGADACLFQCLTNGGQESSRWTSLAFCLFTEMIKKVVALRKPADSSASDSSSDTIRRRSIV